MTWSWHLECSSLMHTPPFHGLDRTQEVVKCSERQTQLLPLALACSLQEEILTQEAQQSSNTAAINMPHCRAWFPSADYARRSQGQLEGWPNQRYQTDGCCLHNAVVLKTWSPGASHSALAGHQVGRQLWWKQMLLSLPWVLKERHRSKNWVAHFQCAKTSLLSCSGSFRTCFWNKKNTRWVSKGAAA